MWVFATLTLTKCMTQLKKVKLFLYSGCINVSMCVIAMPIFINVYITRLK